MYLQLYLNYEHLKGQSATPVILEYSLFLNGKTFTQMVFC